MTDGAQNPLVLLWNRARHAEDGVERGCLGTIAVLVYWMAQVVPAAYLLGVPFGLAWVAMPFPADLVAAHLIEKVFKVSVPTVLVLLCFALSTAFYGWAGAMIVVHILRVRGAVAITRWPCWERLSPRARQAVGVAQIVAGIAAVVSCFLLAIPSLAWALVAKGDIPFYLLGVLSLAILVLTTAELAGADGYLMPTLFFLAIPFLLLVVLIQDGLKSLRAL